MNDCSWHRRDLRIIRALTLVVLAWLSLWTLLAFTGPGIEKDFALMFVAQVALGLWTAYFAWTFRRGHWAIRMILFIAFVQLPQMIVITPVGSYKTGLTLHDFLSSYWHVMSLVVIFFVFVFGALTLVYVIGNYREVDKK